MCKNHLTILMEIGITRLSSKGQIIIPAHLRHDLNVGSSFVVIREEDRFVLRLVDTLDEEFKDDIEFARRTEESFQRYKKDKRTFTTMDGEEFLETIASW